MKRRRDQSNPVVGEVRLQVYAVSADTNVGGGRFEWQSCARYECTMDLHQHNHETPTDAERGMAAEPVGGWRQSLRRLQKNPTVRRHVRCWLLGLISFGPVR
jgi:hypothetical protein